MATLFQPGDFLVFQIEAGFGLLRLLEVEELENDRIWHVAGYDNFFLDVDTAEIASADPTNLSLQNPHIALTTRAFESTQVAKILNIPLTAAELDALIKWKADPDHQVSDRSVRLMLGLR